MNPVAEAAATAPTIERDLVSSEPFALASGAVLPAITQRYAIYGELHADRSNAVLVFHALTGSARIHEWWRGLIGAGCALDTNENAFLCVNYLGSCYGSTGAFSINPETAARYDADFPLLTISDIVRAQKSIVEHLRIEKLKAVVGGSVGGMCALQWSADFPDLTEKCVAIGACELPAMGLALNHLQREALRIENGVGLARQIAMLSYKSAELFDARFARQPNRTGENPREKFENRFDVAGYLDYQSEIFKNRFDAETFKIISKAMDLFEMTDEEISRVKAKTHFVGISSDWLFPARDVRRLTERFLALGVDADYAEMFSPDGHDAFLSDAAKMSEILIKVISEK